MLKFFGVLLFAAACFINNTVAQTEIVYHFPSDTAAVNKSLPDYIDFTDGKKAAGEITKIDLFKKEQNDKITGTISIGENKYDINDIAGYQYQGIYFSRADSKKYMIIRVKHGMINFYRQNMDAEKFNSWGKIESRWVHTRHLIQKGENGDIAIFSFKLLKKYLSDYQPALDILKDCSWNKKTWQGCEDLLEKAIDIYNSR